MADFQGIWRRFELVGEVNEAKIISDYAHHPTEVRSTIEGAKKFYPGKRIIVVFQPHQRNRTKKLFNDFVKSFDNRFNSSVPYSALSFPPCSYSTI